MINLQFLEDQLCEALKETFGDMKIVPILKEEQPTKKVQQKNTLYFSIGGGRITDRATTGSLDCRKAKEYSYDLSFTFYLRNLRTHTTFYSCADELSNSLDGLPIGNPFGQISLMGWSEPKHDESGGFWEWTIQGKVVSYGSTKLLSQPSRITCKVV